MKKTNASIDIAKFILALFVVMIHVNPVGDQYSGIRFPITRIAVPMFFLFSSVLLFGKLRDVESEKEKSTRVFQFCKRNLILYLAWFIVLIPITVYVRGYYKIGFVDSLKDVAVRFLLGSTFPSSWYIMALVIGTLVTFYASKYIKNIGMLIIGFALNILCCMASNYRNLLEQTNGLESILRLIEIYPERIYQSFPVSLVWISIGKIIAEQHHRIGRISLKHRMFASCVAVIILFLEHSLIQKRNWAYASDCYLSLVVVCPLLVSVILGLEMNGTPITKMMRKISIVMYCSHRAFEEIYCYIFRRLSFDVSNFFGAATLFLLVVLSSVVLTIAIDKLKQYRYLQWLQYLQ